MSKRAKLAIAITAALLVCVLIGILLADREPRYKGLTMGQWLDRRLYDARAMEALSALGTNNLPLLVKRINYEPQKDPYPSFFFLVYKLSRSRWVYDIASRRNRQANDAIGVFYSLGPKAAPAVPHLAKIVEGGPAGPRSTALLVLSSVGDKGLAVVASQASTNTALEIRLEAVRLLDQHTDSRVAFLGLTNALSDLDARVRLAASEGISNHLQWNPHLAPTERTQLRQRIQE